MPSIRRMILAWLAALAAAPSLFAAPPLRLDLQTDQPLVAAGRPQSLVLRLGLLGQAPGRRRPPLNLCLVLDKSGSMEGSKINRLREAARQAIGRLRPDDTLSIVAFSTATQVLLPAALVGNGRAALAAVEGLEAEGSTALYAGVQRGLSELARYQDSGRASRLILISDGLANVGPSSPAELAELGRQAGRRGIPVTTFGLGYDYGEDLMTRLASASDGNHAFIPDEGNLAAMLNRELGEALSVAARDLVIEIHLADGVRFKGSLDRDLEVDGQTLRWHLSQLPGGIEKRLLAEVEAPILAEGEKAEVASAKVIYQDAQGAAQPALAGSVEVLGAPEEKAQAAQVPAVAAEAAMARANLNREKAIQLRDSGDTQAAGALLQSNAFELNKAAESTGVSSLRSSASAYESEADAMAAPSADWNAARKAMKAESYKETTQQGY